MFWSYFLDCCLQSLLPNSIVNSFAAGTNLRSANHKETLQSTRDCGQFLPGHFTSVTIPPDNPPGKKTSPGTLFHLPHSTLAKIKGNIKTENCLRCSPVLASCVENFTLLINVRLEQPCCRSPKTRLGGLKAVIFLTSHTLHVLCCNHVALCVVNVHSPVNDSTSLPSKTPSRPDQYKALSIIAITMLYLLFESISQSNGGIVPGGGRGKFQGGRMSRHQYAQLALRTLRSTNWHRSLEIDC